MPGIRPSTKSYPSVNPSHSFVGYLPLDKRLLGQIPPSHNYSFVHRRQGMCLKDVAPHPSDICSPDIWTAISQDKRPLTPPSGSGYPSVDRVLGRRSAPEAGDTRRLGEKTLQGGVGRGGDGGLQCV